MEGLTTLSSDAGRPGQAASWTLESSQTLKSPTGPDATYTRGGLTVAWAQRAKQLTRSDDCITELRQVARPRWAKRVADFRGLAPDDGAVEALAQLIEHGAAVEEIYVEGKDLTDSAAKSLARCLRSGPSIRLLSARTTSIGCDGAKELAQAMKETDSEVLAIVDLSRSEIGDSGAEALADALKSRSRRLKKLSLEGCQLTDEGTPCIANAASEGAVRTVDARHNIRVSPSGHACLYDARNSVHRPSIWFT